MPIPFCPPFHPITSPSTLPSLSPLAPSKSKLFPPRQNACFDLLNYVLYYQYLHHFMISYEVSPSAKPAKNVSEVTTDSYKKLNPESERTCTKKIVPNESNDILKEESKGSNFVTKLNKSVISWVQMSSWTKDFDFEGLSLSIHLLNAYHRERKV